MPRESEALLASIAEADKLYTNTFNFEGRRHKRAQERKGLRDTFRAKEMDEIRLRKEYRDRNSAMRREEWRQLMTEQEQEMMWEEEMDTIRRYWLIDSETQRQHTTIARAKSLRNLEANVLLPAGIGTELRSRDPRKIIDQVLQHSDRAAVVGQGLLELTVLLSHDTEQLHEQLRSLHCPALAVDALVMHGNVLVVKEQAMHFIIKLCRSPDVASDLLCAGVFKVLIDAFATVQDSEARSLGVLILRALTAVYSIATKDCRRSPKEEQEAVAHVVRRITTARLSAGVHAAGLQVLTTLSAHREENMRWLFDQEGMYAVVVGMLDQYEAFDIRIQRSDAAGVICEVIRFMAVLATTAEASMVESALPPALLTRIFQSVKDAHFLDPLVQLVHTQLWQVLMDQHATVVRRCYFPALLRPLIAHIMSAMRAHLRVHTFQFRCAVLLELLLDGLMRHEAIPVVFTVLDAEGPLLLEAVVRECAADAVILERLLRLFHAYATADVKFRSALGRDDSHMVDALHSSLGLHGDDPLMQELGQHVLKLLQG